MGFLIFAKFNSIFPSDILLIRPSFSILLNSVDNAGRVTFKYSANCVRVCPILMIFVPLVNFLNKYTIIRSLIVFLDKTSNLTVVHILHFPDTQRKLFKTSGHSLMRRNVESLVAVSSIDSSMVLNVAGNRLSSLNK